MKGYLIISATNQSEACTTVRHCDVMISHNDVGCPNITVQAPHSNLKTLHHRIINIRERALKALAINSQQPITPKPIFRPRERERKGEIIEAG